MSLLDDMKLTLRLGAEDFDVEVQMLIDAAMTDMARVGVRPELLELDDDGNLLRRNALVWQAIAAFCKSRFGFDNGDAGRFDDAYYRTVIDLMNSKANVADETFELPPLPQVPSDVPTVPGDDTENEQEEITGSESGDGESQ